MASRGFLRGVEWCIIITRTISCTRKDEETSGISRKYGHGRINHCQSRQPVLVEVMDDVEHVVVSVVETNEVERMENVILSA